MLSLAIQCGFRESGILAGIDVAVLSDQVRKEDYAGYPYNFE